MTRTREFTPWAPIPARPSSATSAARRILSPSTPGSNDLTLIADFEGSNPATSTISSGGVVPDTAFDFEGSSGLEDLVVGNAGDGALSLFEGGPEGLTLASVASEPNLPDPTALAFSALTGGQVQFYAATAGRESAELVALSLGIETATTSQLASTAAQNTVAQLVALHEASLPLVATVLTLTIAVPGDEFNFGLAESEATAVAVFLTGTGVSVGQGLSSQGRGGPGGDDGAESDRVGGGCCRRGPGGHRTVGAVRHRSRRGDGAVPAGEPQRRFGCAGSRARRAIVPIRHRRRPRLPRVGRRA